MLDVAIIALGAPVREPARRSGNGGGGGRITRSPPCSAEAELERRVEQRVAEQRRRSDEELRRFASFLSHELRQPLGALGIWAELLETGYWGELDERGRRYLRQISESVRRLGELVSGQVALIRASASELEIERFALKEVLGEVLAELSAAFQERRVSVEVGALPELEADRAQIHQLFCQLLGRSLARAAPGAPLRIEVASDPRASGPLRVWLDDDVRGVPLAEIERCLGDPSGLDLDVPGSMNLAIVQRIAARHGGALRAETSRSGGTRFVLELPR